MNQIGASNLNDQRVQKLVATFHNLFSQCSPCCLFIYMFTEFSSII